MVIKFDVPRVSPGDLPLAKEPEDSGYEIACPGDVGHHHDVTSCKTCE